MLIGCGCQCAEASFSGLPSGPSLASLSQSFPSYSNFPNSTGGNPTWGCIACEALAATSAYRVYIQGMTEKPPSLFGDWGCMEMLNTPYLVYVTILGDQINSAPPIDSGPLVQNSQFCHYTTVTDPDRIPFSVRPPQNVFNGYYRPGEFYQKHVIGQQPPGTLTPYKCGDVPDTVFQLHKYDARAVPGVNKILYQAWLSLMFRGIYVVLEQGPPVSAVASQIYLRYSSQLFEDPLLCLNWFTLNWVDTVGSLERQAPAGGWETYGFGPGNNFSYQFDRGDFPAQIRVRPE